MKSECEVSQAGSNQTVLGSSVLCGSGDRSTMVSPPPSASVVM